MTARKNKRHQPISVSGATYAALRQAVMPGSLAKLVDSLVTTALDDPKILARVVASCRAQDAGS